MGKIIAIDGPASSGKSTVGQAVAEKLGYLYFDTGLLYRAVTSVALERQIAVEVEPTLSKFTAQLQIEVRPASQLAGGHAEIWVDGQDVTADLRSPAVDGAVSVVAANPQVRQILTEQMRKIGLQGAVVMVGRDIGTVVLPNADLKVYLDASIEARAERRYNERVALGDESRNYAEILHNLRERDDIDQGREAAPLEIAADAYVLDTTDKSVEAVVAEIVGQVIER